MISAAPTLAGPGGKRRKRGERRLHGNFLTSAFTFLRRLVVVEAQSRLVVAHGKPKKQLQILVGHGWLFFILDNGGRAMVTRLPCIGVAAKQQEEEYLATKMEQ